MQYIVALTGGIG
ncbi:dephospho-CoA kinase, partial [Sodalis-like endosymbiont of Proechinophthirus fluctus]